MDKATSQLSLPEAPRKFGSFVDGSYVPARDRKVLRAITGYIANCQADIELGKRDCWIK